jgi:hypothetical protein
MKQLIPCAMLVATLCFGQSAPPAAAAGGRGGRGGGAPNGAPRELPSNQESNVDIDHFIGFPSDSFMRIFNGGLMLRSMLRHGDPYKPGPTGAVLEYRDDCVVATLEPHFETGALVSDAIYIYYVQGGMGKFDSGPGTESYDLHPGVGVLIAPGAKQHFINTGDKELSMIMVTWKDNSGMTVKQPIKVVDAQNLQFGTNRAHWVMAGKNMFGPPDGINSTFSPVWVPAGTYTGPHAHVPGVEELWVKTGFDEGYMILGSEIRRVNGPGAFLAPPNGKTTHSSMNLTDHPEIWLYISHREPGATGPTPPASRAAAAQ